MDKIRCLVIEDEPLSQDVLSRYIAEVPSLELAGICADAFQASELMRGQPIDLIFLDINLPKVSGMSFLKTLAHPPPVIFTTAYPGYAAEGFEADAVDYLVKPFSFERFLKAVNKACERVAIIRRQNSPELPVPQSSGPVSSTPPGHILLRADKRVHKVDLADISYLEATGDYIKVFTSERCLLVHGSFRSALEQLPPEHFIRVHKSFIIPFHRIRYIEGNQVKVDNTLLPVGKVYKEDLLKKLNMSP